MFLLWAAGLSLFMYSPWGYFFWWTMAIVPFYILIGRPAIEKQGIKRESFLKKVLIGMYIAVAYMPVYWVVALLLFSPSATEVLVDKTTEILEVFDGL